MGARMAGGTDGFSLIETIVAVALLAVALLSLVQLTLYATTANVEARRDSMAALLAADKIEELRVAINFPPSPANALQQNAAGFCDFLDAWGRQLGTPGGTAAPAGAAFVRRWSIRPAGPAISDPITLEVVAVPDPSLITTGPARVRYRGEAHVSAIITRRP